MIQYVWGDISLYAWAEIEGLYILTGTFLCSLITYRVFPIPLDCPTKQSASHAIVIQLFEWDF